MNKALDHLYRNVFWYITLLAIIAYLAFRTLTFDGNIERALRSYDTWANIVFVIFLNITVQTGAIEAGITQGVSTPEFETADELNNKVILGVANELKEFRAYVHALNKEEQTKVLEDYLFKVGKLELDELTEKEKKALKKIKPIYHDIYGFNLPLYYELSKNGKIDYQASFNKNKGIIGKRIRKVITGVMYGALTVNMTFNAMGIKEALISIAIISVGLALTYITSFTPQVFKLKFALPKKVILKKNLFDSYLARKTK